MAKSGVRRAPFAACLIPVASSEGVDVNSSTANPVAGLTWLLLSETGIGDLYLGSCGERW
jgi:hypothetical protein